MLPSFKPVRPVEEKHPFNDPEWLFELKHDGFRALAYIERARLPRDEGRSQFYDLYFRRKEPVYYAFDLLWLNGEDLRELPFLERKARLKERSRTSGGM